MKYIIQFFPFVIGMIVKAKPLKHLCEHQGRGLPDEYKSDCWNDVDETEYACSEKKRILLHNSHNSGKNFCVLLPFFVPKFVVSWQKRKEKHSNSFD